MKVVLHVMKVAPRMKKRANRRQFCQS
jgi:hypothetical protein